MNLQDVIKACGPLPQIPQNMPGSNKKNNLVYIGAILLVGGIGYVIYREWKRRKDIDKE